MAERTVIDDVARDVRLEVLTEGAGEPVVLVPSAMRGAEDFAHLQHSLTAAGYRSLAVNPRGAGRSTAPAEDIALRDFADDIAFVVDEFADGRAHLVGHANGNTVVRATASYRPEVVATVTVMPCGGHNLNAYPVPNQVLAAFQRCHDETLSDQERLEALGIAFFAPGNDARSWLDGWWPMSASGALLRSDPEEWWRAGTAPILIIQPREDAMAPVGVGRDAAAALGDRATYIEIPQCGHAILPEQPEAIAEHVIGFLQAHPFRPA